MPYADLKKDEVLVDNGNDAIVVISAVAEIPGGRTLDVSAYTGDVVRAGHVLVQDGTTGAVSPLGVTDGAYNALATGQSYLGVLKNSVLAKLPTAAIVTMGQVNAAAAPYPITDAIKAGLSNIQFIY